MGVAMATSGSTMSHFVMWYSIHSRWMEMSPFVEVEVGPAEQVLDVVGVQVHAVDFVRAAPQQPLAEGVADEAVDAEDQHASSRRLGCGALAQAPNFMPSTRFSSRANCAPLM